MYCIRNDLTPARLVPGYLLASCSKRHQMDSSVYGGGSEVASGHTCLTTNA